MHAISKKNRRLAAMTALIAFTSVGGCVSTQDNQAVPTIDGKKPTFVASSQLLVIRKGRQAQAGKAVAEDDYVPTQVLVVRSPVVMERTAKILDAKGTAKLDGDSLGARVRVKREEPNTNVLRLTWYGNDEKEGPIVLDAWINAYKEFLDARYRDAMGPTLDSLQRTRDVLMKDLRQAERNQLDFIKKNREIFVVKVDVDSAALLEQKHRDAKLELTRFEGRLAEFDKHKNDESGQTMAKVWAVKTGFPATTEKVDVLYRNYLAGEIREKTTYVEEISRLLNDAKLRVLEMAGHEVEERTLAADVARQRLLFDEAVKAISAIQQRDQHEGFEATILSQPTVKPFVDAK